MIITKGDGYSQTCSEVQPCEAKCNYLITIAFSKTQFVTSFGIFGGLELTSGHGSHLCNFNIVEAQWKGAEQDLRADIKDADLKTEAGSTVPMKIHADDITVRSKCESNVPCVFKVKDIAHWEELTLAGTR